MATMKPKLNQPKNGLLYLYLFYSVQLYIVRYRKGLLLGSVII